MPHRHFPALPPLFGRHLNLLTGLLLMVVAWIIYLPSARYDFVYYGDVQALKLHPELYGQPELAGDTKAIVEKDFPREEPLLVRNVSWAVDSLLFGFGNPLGYHLGNVLLNGLVAGLLFVVLVHTTRRYRFPVLTTVAFVLLAVHVEPVTWIIGREELLAALFMLLALYAQIRRLTAASRWAEGAWYGLTLLFFVAGLLSKINVLTFPLVLFLHAILFPWLRGEPELEGSFWKQVEWSKEIKLAVPTLVISGIVFGWYQHRLEETGFFDRGGAAHVRAHLWNLLMINPLVFWKYLEQIFLPTHLMVLQAWPVIQPVYPGWQLAVALATVASIIGAGIWLFWRRKDLFFFYAAFFILMIPCLNLINTGIWMSDRYVYFPSFCVLAIAAATAEWLWLKSPRLARVAVVVLGMGLAAENLYQLTAYEPQWRDAETLWQYHIAQADHTPTAYANLAGFYQADFDEAAGEGDHARAAKSMEKMAGAVDAGLADAWRDHRQPPPPDTWYLFFQRSRLELAQGKPEAALQSLLMSDRLRPRVDATSLSLSRIYDQLAKTTKDPQQRAADLTAARDRFVEYIALEYQDGQPPYVVRAELASLRKQCADLPKTVR